MQQRYVREPKQTRHEPVPQQPCRYRRQKRNGKPKNRYPEYKCDKLHDEILHHVTFMSGYNIYDNERGETRSIRHCLLFEKLPQFQRLCSRNVLSCFAVFGVRSGIVREITPICPRILLGEHLRPPGAGVTLRGSAGTAVYAYNVYYVK